jgi:hypothetical protein
VPAGLSPSRGGDRRDGCKPLPRGDRAQRNLCSVKGPGSASFDYTVQPESAINTWSQQVSTIKGDDGEALSELDHER